jgi:uncharacterized membrane protein YeiH
VRVSRNAAEELSEKDDGLTTGRCRVFFICGVGYLAMVDDVIARRETLDPVGFVTLAVLSGLGVG